MPDILSQALATPGLVWLALAIFVAGLVRGFSGFGSALIIMPVASSVLSPFAALAFLTTVELFGPIPNLPNALRMGRKREAALLIFGAALSMPLGLILLSQMSAEVFSWIVSLVVLCLLVILISGWRYTGALSQSGVTAIGALGGFCAGFAGLPGPPVIMFYMSSVTQIAVIRANFLLYLLGIDVLMIAALVYLDALDVTAILLGLILMLPYILANAIGAQFFNPKAERSYRTVAYIIIAISAMLGLPIWT